MTGRLVSACLSLLAVALLGACAGRAPGSPGAGPGGDQPVTTEPGPAPTPEPEVTPPPSPLIVTPRPGFVDVRARPWEGVEVRGDRELLLRFYGGVEECYGVARVDVDYGPEAVTVTLYEGRVPSAEVCIEIAVLKGVRVDLEESLRGRPIADGAAGRG